MERPAWRRLLWTYLPFIIAFPLGMWWVESRPLSGPTTCAFRLVTHLDCPACGLTRAFRAMGRLDVATAVHVHPLGPAVFLFTVGYWGYLVARLVSRERVALPVWWSQHRMYTWLLALFLAVGAVRIGVEFAHPPPPPRPMTARQQHILYLFTPWLRRP